MTANRDAAIRDEAAGRIEFIEPACTEPHESSRPIPQCDAAKPSAGNVERLAGNLGEGEAGL